MKPAPAPLRKHQEITLAVERLALGGRGLARHEGMVVFVEGALPGDRVRARVTRRRPQYAEAVLVERLAEGPGRVEAPCGHYRERECGGCRFQDLAYERQLSAKEEQVRETLAHLGGQAEATVHPIVASPERFRYRNKMEFTFHPGECGEPLLGLHRRGRFDRVFALDACWLCSDLTNRVVGATQRFARERGWPAYHPRRHEGLVRFLVVRHLPHTDQAMVNLVAAASEVPGVEAWADEIASLDERIRSVLLNVNASRANVAAGEPGRERVLRGRPTIEERLAGLVFEAGAGTFLQTNSRQAERLYEATLEEAALEPGDRVLDVYCGAGTISLLLARSAGEVLGIESVASAVDEARRNAERNGIENARFLAGEARAVLREWAEPWTADVIVADPPRAGLHPRVLARLAEQRPRRLVYVSCNPATLSRDVAGFAERGLRLERVRPFDLFPHTAHVECVATLVATTDQ